MTHENHILDALLIILATEIPEEELAHAITDQARLRAGMNSDELWEDHPNTF
jgi:hypothetical protein